jgi:uncharacterized protein YbjT (DUF2867 family)
MEAHMILVTGAAGLSGSAIVKEFSLNKVAVRALVRDRAKAEAIAKLPGVDIVEGDMARPDTIAPALEGVDRAMMISSASPTMLATQTSFIDACRAAGVAHVVKFSGRESGVGFEAANFPFTRMHEEIEDYLENSGLSWTHLRPSQFMQVYLREARTIAGSGMLLLPLENVALSPVDIVDIAKIAFAVLTSEGYENRSLDITGPQALKMAEIAEIISKTIDKPVRYRSIGPEEHRRAMTAAGLPFFTIDALGEQAAERRRHPQSNVDLGAHKAFGIKPTRFEQFAQRHAAIFRGDRA